MSPMSYVMAHMHWTHKHDSNTVLKGQTATTVNESHQRHSLQGDLERAGLRLRDLQRRADSRQTATAGRATVSSDDVT